MPREGTYEGLIHAGAGSGLFLVQLAAIIPGLLPGIAIAAVIGLVAVLPVVVLGAVAMALALPPYAVWRLATRRRRREVATEPTAHAQFGGIAR